MDPSSTPGAMELAWLQLNQANPRTLSPQLLQLKAMIHAALNSRMARDPYGIVSLTPPGPTYQQQLGAFQHQHSQQPAPQSFPPMTYQRPFFGKDLQPKTGMTFEPSGGTQWGL